MTVWRSRLLRTGAILLVLTPFSLSVAGRMVSNPPTPVAAAPRPSLRFAEYLLNLGEIEPGPGVRAIFHFQNTANEQLTITKIKPSCGCLVHKLPQKTFAPGENGLLLVTPHTTGVGSDNQDSVKEYYIDVTYEAGDGPRTERVHITFLLPPRRVVVEPKALLIYQGNSQTTRRTITVTDRRSLPASVADVRCENKNVELEWKANNDPSDPIRATITVTIPPATDGEYSTKIEIKFDDPDTAPVYVPIIVEPLATDALQEAYHGTMMSTF